MSYKYLLEVKYRFRKCNVISAGSHYHRIGFLWPNGGSGGAREGEMEDNDVRSGKMMKG